ncbi:unnamed protein product [Spirodela intermedia]|uniref:Late embryogenesis abundant protein LEA-2 subgroup domain-containing protein n=2 Tax=Spirodela intermedia TaxID=51605 RepID=A0A7I8J0I3_SPIIN|nr:unnamed protein product [Spirodela intermedia]CAA6663736.1 unnamed protein product [Spirodela intermedia]CAA7400229.1 unnamed protein product [Spirodela intermedia]
MSKDCGNHKHWLKKKYRHSLYCLLGFVLLILFTVLVIWLVLRPTKPKFYLQDATVYAFNQSGSPTGLLTTSIQVTLSTRNPNDRIGVYYDKLDVYASYQNQQITMPTVIPPTYQGHNDVVVWSPFLYAVNVPIAPYLCASLLRDQNAGVLLLNVKVNGRLRWKVGSWTSGRYHIFVNCPALLTFGGGAAGYSPLIRFQQMSTCTVDV